MSIKNVKISNFTVFQNIDINLASGINVIIGENGTGKTHLMKLMYANIEKDDVYNYFKVKRDEDLRRNIEEKYSYQYSFDDKEEMVSNKPTDFKSSIFIPAKDFLTHSKGFLSMYDKFDMPFDKTYYDIISKSLLPNLKKIPEIGKAVLPKLENIIGGKVIVENETFFIQKLDGKKVEFSMEAEGIKKIAILWQLIMNESITRGTVLFWDEPEANINPMLFKDVAEILLTLSRNDVQIFVATHNYVFAKYVEVLMEDTDEIAFHALYNTENEGVKCETEKKFSLLTHNAIREENINLYDAEMKKEFSS